ncbi:MAG: AMP-binding protein, partial [Planctomycetota bacterium]
LLIAQNAALQGVLQHQPGDRWLATLPIFVLAHLAEGATAILADADLRRPARINGNRLATQVERGQVDAVVAAPSLLQRLASARSKPKPFRKVFTGGAPVFPSSVERLRPLSASGDITVVYGSTEAEPVAHLVCEPGCSWTPTLQGDGLPVGRPCSAVNLRLIRTPLDGSGHVLSEHEFARLCVPDGDPGEVVVTGDHVVKGYVDGVGDEVTKLHVGSGANRAVWHRTGDAARFDTDGCLWLLGRCNASVSTTSGGIRFPFEVEAPLREQFGIECALIEHRSVSTLAIASQSSNAVPGLKEAVRQVADEGIEVVSVPSIPLDKRHNGKTDYAALACLLDKERAC